jgi:hypothetical protein
MRLYLQLLVKDPARRLGAQEDASEIKRHPFFHDMNWQALSLKKIQPPFIPQIVRYKILCYNFESFQYKNDDFLTLCVFCSGALRMSPILIENLHLTKYVFLPLQP